MACRRGVFYKLSLSESFYILNTLYLCRIQICRETLIAKNGQTLFECELKPVTAGDTVTRPVMKIFMSNNALNTHKVRIGCASLICEYISRIKYIESFVLHSTHVETIYCYYIVDIKIILPSVLLLIPEHRLLERLHSMRAFCLISLVTVYVK